MLFTVELTAFLAPHAGTNEGLVARYSSDDESSDGEGEGSEEDGELHHGWRLRTADEAEGALPAYVRERLSDQSAYIQKLEAQNLDLQEVCCWCPVTVRRLGSVTCSLDSLDCMLTCRKGAARAVVICVLPGQIKTSKKLTRLCSALQRCSLLQHELQELKAACTTLAAAAPSEAADYPTLTENAVEEGEAT